jgi:hypothetical protein
VDAKKWREEGGCKEKEGGCGNRSRDGGRRRKEREEEQGEGGGTYFQAVLKAERRLLLPNLDFFLLLAFYKNGNPCHR